MLLSVGNAKMSVIKIIKETLGCDLKEAKELSEKLPSVVMTDTDMIRLKSFQSKLLR